MDNLQNPYGLVSELLQLPKQILKHIHTHNLTDLLLGHLASENYFNLKKAAYLLNNPEFNCVKGLSGIEDHDIKDWKKLWEDPAESAKRLANSSYNQKIKSFASASPFADLGAHRPEELVEYAKQNFAFNNPVFIGWHGKHGNYGLFFCEPRNPQALAEQLSLLEHATPLLSITHS